MAPASIWQTKEGVWLKIGTTVSNHALQKLSLGTHVADMEHTTIMHRTGHSVALH